MTQRADIPGLRQIFTHHNKASPSEAPLRERPSSRFRIKSELRNPHKMPPINSLQPNTSTNISRNPLFPGSKTPLRRALRPRPGDGPSQLDESSPSDYLSRPGKLLSIETTEPKGYLPINQNNSSSQNVGASTGDNSMRILNPMTSKQTYSVPLVGNILTTKSHNTLKPKAFPPRKPHGIKPNSLSKSNVSGSTASSTPERGDLYFAQEDKNNNSVGGNAPSSLLPHLEPTRCSTKKSGVVKAYAANTNQGIVRNYNEDRVAIILNIMKPLNTEFEGEWPMCSFFGVYDGHGGTECADFLRDNLHQFIIRDKNFPFTPIEALKNGFHEAEKQFTEWAEQQSYGLNRAGSCAIVALIVGIWYI